MKKAGLLLLSAAFVTGCGGSGGGGDDVKLNNEDKKASYAIGFMTGEQMKGKMKAIDLDAFIAGMRNGVRDEDKPQIDPDKMPKLIEDFQERKMKERQKEREKAGKENAKKSEKFLEKNAKKEGVKTLDNGLQYKVLESGEKGGESPEEGDIVKVHYHGTLIDGTVFDSSIDREKPAKFPLSQRIVEGWQVALPKMKVGDKWKLFVPPELGYGEQGAGDKIGPNETLIFELELLDVQESEGQESGAKDSGGESSSSESKEGEKAEG